MLVFISFLHNATPDGLVLPPVKRLGRGSVFSWLGKRRTCALISASILVYLEKPLICLCLWVQAAQINLIFKKKSLAARLRCEEKWEFAAFGAPVKTPFRSTLPLLERKRDGWRELALQAHLSQLWKRSIAAPLPSLIPLSFALSQLTLPPLFPLLVLPLPPHPPPPTDHSWLALSACYAPRRMQGERCAGIHVSNALVKPAWLAPTRKDGCA